MCCSSSAKGTELAALSNLTIYPLKSAAGVDLQTSGLDRFGLVGDRRWMLVDAHNRFVTQRDEPRLARLQALPIAGGLALAMEERHCELVIDDSWQAREVTVWGSVVMALDAGEQAAQWLQAGFGKAWRLVYMPDNCQRRVDPHYAAQGETVSFADGFPLLLISQRAVDELGERLGEPVAANRFRANIVVDGCQAHAEDQWQRIRIGDAQFVVAKPCSRCVVPSIDQGTAQKHRRLLRTLASYRRGDDGQTYFGQNLLQVSGNALAVGDEVEVLA